MVSQWASRKEDRVAYQALDDGYGIAREMWLIAKLGNAAKKNAEFNVQQKMSLHACTVGYS